MIVIVTLLAKNISIAIGVISCFALLADVVGVAHEYQRIS